jgi:hypothetical protein
MLQIHTGTVRDTASDHKEPRKARESLRGEKRKTRTEYNGSLPESRSARLER